MLPKLLIIGCLVCLPAGALAKEAETMSSRLDTSVRPMPAASSAGLAALLQAHAVSTSGPYPFALAPVGRDRNPTSRQQAAIPHSNRSGTP